MQYINGRILEPSAGKGDLIKHILGERRHRDSTKIDAIENDPRLVSQLMSEGHSVVWDDFLTYETYKEYDYIVMNPPFSNGVDHVLKALDLADAQLSHCEIFAILNKKTIDNAFSNKRQDLLRRLDEHGAEIRYVKDAFTQAERRTDVEVALIHVKVAKEGVGRNIYDSIPFFTADRQETEEALETSLSTHVKASEMAEKMNDIERLVIEYETACELARDTYKAITDKQSFFSYITQVNKREGSTGSSLYLTPPKEYRAEDLSEELDKLRRGYWELILDTKDFREMLTNEAIRKLNRQMSVADEMEINLVNIRMLLTALSANQRDILLESVVSIFEKITTHHLNAYSSNIHYYDGWKTNDAYRINKKIIIPIQYSSFEPTWDFDTDFHKIKREVREYIRDIVKAFQLIDPSVSDEFVANSSQEFENDLLRFRMFLNGNIHVWFKDESLLNRLNYLCGSHFGWIPSEGEQEESAEAREWVAKEFGDIGGTVRLMRT